MVSVIHHRQFFLGDRCNYIFSPVVGITVERRSKKAAYTNGVKKAD